MSTLMKQSNNNINIPIYLDYSATTPVDPRVAAKMSECLTKEGSFGNPASRSHSFGWESEKLVDEARGHVANLIKANKKEIIWTSGATESDNLAIKGAAHFYKELLICIECLYRCPVSFLVLGYETQKTT